MIPDHADGFAGAEVVEMSNRTRNGARNGNANPMQYVQGNGNENESHAENEQRETRELPPLMYCSFIANHPKLAFGKAFGVVTVVTRFYGTDFRT